LLEQDTESTWLNLDPDEDTDAKPQILGSSVSYRIAVGPQQGRKAFMIRTYGDEANRFIAMIINWITGPSQLHQVHKPS
jgi:hypothetical protein